MGSVARMAAIYIILSVILIVAMFPIFWIVSTSFKPPSQIFGDPELWLPTRLATISYQRLFFAPWLREVIGNSLIASLGGTAMAVGLGFPAAYSISRGVKGRRFIFTLTAIPRLAPPVVFAIPFLVFYNNLGMLDTHLGLILVYGMVTTFFVIWITKPFIDNIPVELEEASLLDGDSRLATLFKVILPLSKKGLVAAALFSFILSWTEFLLALILTNVEVRTIPVQLAIFGAFQSGNVGPLAALTSVSLIPLLFVAYFLQKYLFAGLSMRIVGRQRDL